MRISRPHVEIRQTFAKIGLQSNPSRFSMEQPQADLQVRQTFPRLQIVKTPFRFEMNSSQARLAYGQKGIVPFVFSMAAESQKQAMIAIGRIAQDGDRMMDIANKEDAVAELVYQHQFDQSVIEYVDPPALHPVSVQYEPFKLEMTWRLGNVDIYAKANPPKISYDPRKLEVYILKKASISIDVVGQYVDEKK